LAHYVGDIHRPLHVGAVYLDALGKPVNPNVGTFDQKTSIRMDAPFLSRQKQPQPQMINSSTGLRVGLVIPSVQQARPLRVSNSGFCRKATGVRSCRRRTAKKMYAIKQKQMVKDGAAWRNCSKQSGHDHRS